MRTSIARLLLICSVVLGACTPRELPTTETPALVPTSTLTPVTPTGTAILPPVAPFSDVRWMDLAELDVNLGKLLIQGLWFNQDTRFSAGDRRIADQLLQAAMNPGLGVRALHAQDITGKGVIVAIIDQHLHFAEHPEYKGKIVKIYDTGTQTSVHENSMHGPSVLSLLVGENIGTAPDARVYYAAAPTWNGDAQYYADALNWIVDENTRLPAGSKIRAVSVSTFMDGPDSPFTKNQAAWGKAYQRATDSGLLVIELGYLHRSTGPCTRDLEDAENVATCVPGWPSMSGYAPAPDGLGVPTSPRTTALEPLKGVFSYQYTGEGGDSWEPPYLTGVLAMAWQVRSDLTAAQLLEMASASAYVTDEGAKILNPPAFIEMVEHAAK